MIVNGRVLTEKGIQHIHELDIGDQVFSHSGQLESIIGLAKKLVPANSSLVRECVAILRIDGELDDLEVTADHNILVKTEDGLEFKSAQEVEIGDWIAVPRIRSEGTKGAQINLDMAWFLGLYMRNGIIMEKGDNTIIGACFPKEMNQESVARFCKISGQFGAEKVDAKFDERIEKYWVHIWGDTMLQVLRSLFHRADSNVPARVPIEFHSWNLDQKTQFLSGALAGCSHRIDSVKHQQSWLTHNLEMSYGLYFIASSLGITIEHDIDLWDFQGIINAKKEVNRDEEYIYKRVTYKKLDSFKHETCVYGIEVGLTATMCLGASLVSAVLQ